MTGRAFIILGFFCLGLAGAWGCAPKPPPASDAAPEKVPSPGSEGLWFHDNDRNCADLDTDPGLGALVKALAPPVGGRLLVIGDVSGCISKVLLQAAGAQAQLHVVVNYAFEALEVGLSLAGATQAKVFLNDYDQGPSPDGPSFPGSGQYDLALVVGFAVSGPEDLAAARPLLGATATRVVFLHAGTSHPFHPAQSFSPEAASFRLALDGPANPLTVPVAGDRNGPSPATLAALNGLLAQPDLMARTNSYFNARTHTASEIGAFLDSPSFSTLRWLARIWPLLTPGAPGAIPARVQLAANSVLLSAYYGLADPELRRYRAVRATLESPTIVTLMKKCGYQPAPLPSPFVNRHLTAFRRS